MKKQFIHIVITLIFIISCASKYDKTKIEENKPTIIVNDTLKEKHAVVSDFLDTKIKDGSKKIMIHSKKINTNMTLKILRLNDIYVLDSLDNTKGYEDKTFYKEAEWEIVRKKYSKNSVTEIENATFKGGECCWTAENFNYKNIIFEELDFGTPAYEKKYFFGLNEYGYEFEDFYISEPIYYQNKEYLIFTFSHGNVFPTYEISTKIIIYKKKNGKWVQTHEGLPNWFS
jgi:hypothetical protein